MESVLDANVVADELDWGGVLSTSSMQDDKLTGLCNSDTADLVVRDASGGIWFFEDAGHGWDVEFAGWKAEYRWTDDMVGDVDEAFLERFQKELAYELNGVNVIRLKDTQGVIARTEFEKAFEFEIERKWEAAMGSAAE